MFMPCGTEPMRTEDLLAQGEEPTEGKDKAVMPQKGLLS